MSATITVVGTMGQDAKLLGEKGDRLGFSVAVNTGWGDNVKTTWYNCTKWGKGSDALMGMLKKGTRLIVIGKLDTYKSKEGEVKLSINVLEVVILNTGKSKGDGSKSQSKEDHAKEAAGDDKPFDDEIPF